jgi:hypothetical protein
VRRLPIRNIERWSVAPLRAARRRRSLCAACILLGAVAAPVGATATTVKPIVDVRLRYEGVDQQGVAEQSNAVTLRGRIGVEAGQGPFTALVEGEGTLALDEDYFSGVNRKSARPLVGDPENVELNRAQLQFHTATVTATVGRQRIILDDQRFVGTAAWRQNEQTYDAAHLEWRPLPKLKLDVTYAWALRTVWGIDGGARGFVNRPQAIDGGNVFVNLSTMTRLGTATGFFYRVEEDEAPAVLRRNSSDSYGASLVGRQPLAKGWNGLYSLRYARQRDNGVNSLDYSTDYLFLEAELEHGGWAFGLGLERLGADRSVILKRDRSSVADGFAFQTPFGLLHKFQGWADKFVTTPPLGVADHYGSAGYGWKNVGPFDAVAAIALLHRYTSAEGGIRYGDEANLRLTATMGHYAFLLKYADYHRRGQASFAGDASVRKLWMSGEWIF